MNNTSVTDWDDDAIEVEEEEEVILQCPRHPKMEARLRCYQCGAPICIKCARRTPVGYICPDCLSGRKQRFEQATSRDLILAGLVSLVLGSLASLLLNFSSWFILFLSPLAGLGIAEVAWRAAQRHYSFKLKWVVTAALFLSAAPCTLFSIGGAALLAVFSLSDVFQALSLLWGVVHLALMCGAAFARLK